MTSPELKRVARIFGVGALCGFIGGAALVAVLITKYGHGPHAVAGSPRQSSGVSVDGLATVDAQVREGSPRPAAVGTAGVPPAVMTPSPPPDLARRDLEMPVEGVKPEQLVRSFDQERSGARSHQAIDILAPRNTPVNAVEDGKIVR